MDQLLNVVTLLTKHPVLHLLSLQQLVEFLTLTSRLKRSILLAKRAAEPTTRPPEILPRLIQRFLAESIGIKMEAIPDSWSILKDYAWTMSTISSWAEKEEEAFRSYGWKKGLSKCAV
jgi:hypothetical protein